MSERRSKRARSVSIERGIRKIRLDGGQVRFRVQLGRRGKGNRRSHLCATFEEAKALKEEWMLRGLPPRDVPTIKSHHDVVASVDDGFRHRALDLEQRWAATAEKSSCVFANGQYCADAGRCHSGNLRQEGHRLLHARTLCPI